MLDDVPRAIQNHISETLKTKLKNFSFSGGGCINHGGKLSASKGDFFLKWNDAKKFPDMLKAEAKGLNLLRRLSGIHVPEVILNETSENSQFLLLEFIDQKPRARNYWQEFGSQLASLHQNTSATFGLEHDNYIGSLKQFNKPEKNWVIFFIKQRLQIQVKLGVDHRKINSQISNQFEILYTKLPDLLPMEKPSLLHGDLWSGNLLTDSLGNPTIIDPAVYYGNREAEIAFTSLFGGFSENFYKYYQESSPLQPGYSDRIDIYNLYPLMVHVNLFGGGYLTQVVSILKHFV